MDLCFFAFLVIPDSSLAPWKCLCGHCWIPGWILGLELENKKGFVQPPVAPSLWNCPAGAGGPGVSAQSPGQLLEVFPVVPVASGCRSGGF